MSTPRIVFTPQQLVAAARIIATLTDPVVRNTVAMDFVEHVMEMHVHPLDPWPLLEICGFDPAVRAW